jgi:DNA-binding LacI/PurR family transcriptional regulator
MTTSTSVISSSIKCQGDGAPRFDARSTICVFSSKPNEAGGYQIAQQLLAMKDRPTAIVLVNESIAIGFYRGMSEAGLKPGRDIAIIGRQSRNRISCRRV